MNVLLCSNQRNELRAIKYIEDSNIENFNKAILDLSEYEKFDLSLKICLSNAKILVEFCRYVSIPDEELSIDFALERNIEYKFGELITNFLSSYYNFIEYCKYNSKKWLGEEGYEATKKILSEFYDIGYFYQFYPRFRNYITHFGLPIHLSYATLKDNKKLRVFLVFSEILLASNQSWGPDFKKELERISSGIGQLNLLKMFELCDSHFALLAKSLHDYYIKRISNSIVLISNHMMEYDLNSYRFYFGIYNSTKQFEDIAKGIAEGKITLQYEHIYTTAIKYQKVV